MVVIPARYILAFMSFAAITVQYTIKVNLSVAIVAMVEPEMTRKAPVTFRMWFHKNTSLQSERVSGGKVYWDADDQALALSSYYYGYVTTQLLGGYASERWGSRYLCGAAVLVAGLLTLTVPPAAQAGLQVFVPIRFAVGATSGIILPAVNCLVAEWLPPKERTRLTGIIFAAPNFGSVLAMALSGLLVGYAHWSVTFYLFGAVAVILVIPWIFLIYDSPRKHPRISQNEKFHILEGLGEKIDEEEVAPPVPWGRLLTSVPMWAAILFNCSTAWIRCTLLTELPTYLTNMFDMSVEESGMLSAVPFLFAWIIGSSFGFLSQWVMDKGWLSRLAAYRVFNGIAGLGGAASLVAVTLVGKDKTAVMVLMVTTMVSGSALFGGSYLNHMDLARNFAGVIAGLLHTVITFTGILAPLTVGVLTENNETFEQWNKVFYTAAAISVCTLLLYLMFGSVDEQPWNVPQPGTHQVNTSTEQESNRV